MSLRDFATPVAVWGGGLLGAGYLWNRPIVFLAGAALLAIGLVGCSLLAFRSSRRLLGFALNTGLCLLLGVLCVDAFVLGRAPDAVAPVYSFADARGDPAAARAWWDHYVAEWLRSQERYMRRDPTGRHRFVLIPGASGPFFGSQVRINRSGFRGEELAPAERGLYRIVALGESTTFGVTLERGDRTWPEVLERLLNERLACEARFEVVNAGIPAWTLEDNLRRLEAEILPLEPEIVISYHGYNGFHLLREDLPETDAGLAPIAPERPSRLIARLETALRTARSGSRYRTAGVVADELSDADLLSTRYAALYRRLIGALGRRGVPLVLTTFNMAANEATAEEVVLFYSGGFPDARTRILANRMHTRLLERLASRPGVTLVDTSAGLDGAYQDAYIDLIHFTQEGRNRLARNVFAGIRGQIQEDPRAGCPDPGA